MNMNIVKTGGFLVMAAISGVSGAGENVAQSNIAAIFQPVVPAAVEGIAPADGVSLLDGKIQELRDPSLVTGSAVEASETEESVARSNNVAQDNIRGIYTAYSAN